MKPPTPFNKTLCLDFGNTRLKAALFSNDNFVQEIILPNDEMVTIQKLIHTHQPGQTILSSVIHHNPAIENYLSAHTKFHKISAATKINFTTPVGDPHTIGADRLALCAAAVHYYPTKNNLVIGLGSCITYNFVNQYHQFLGGGISPGMQMRFKAMEVFTDKLPLAEWNWNFPLIGYDTLTNLQSGVIAGIAFEMEGFINAYEEKFNNLNVILTGGDTDYFSQKLKKDIFADAHFLYKGLYALSQANND